MINPSYLAELAEYTDGKIAKVVVNGTLEITDFDVRELDDNVIELEYRILYGTVAEATQIELQTAGGQMISSNAVFVPITTDTIIKQTVTVKEA